MGEDIVSSAWEHVAAREGGGGLAIRREDKCPWIEGEISTVPGMSVEILEDDTDVTVVAQLANGMQYTLYAATCKAGFEINTRDGQLRVRWEGVTCEEVQL